MDIKDQLINNTNDAGRNKKVIFKGGPLCFVWNYVPLFS